MAHNIGNYRSATFSDLTVSPRGPLNLYPSHNTNVRNNQMANSVPPPLPPPYSSQPGNFYYSSNRPFPGYSECSHLFSGNGGMGSYGGFENYGGVGYYNRLGGRPSIHNAAESRIIQIAEERTRHAFQSIESVVGAIGNIADMLDSSFFALTTSFRAMLGIATNFSRLRSLFAQFWSTFAIFRGLNWMMRRVLYLLKISDLDTSSAAFKEAFDDTQKLDNFKGTRKQFPWPMVAFIGLIFSASYLVMKLINSVVNSAIEKSKNPKTWIHPIESTAIYSFQPRNSDEIALSAGQKVLIAPKGIQNMHKLLSTGWAIATTDGQTSGFIPITYVQGPNQAKEKNVSQSVPAERMLQKMEGADCFELHTAGHSSAEKYNT